MLRGGMRRLLLRSQTHPSFYGAVWVMRRSLRQDLKHLALTSVLVSLPLPSVATEVLASPRLILQITVDALRGDLPTRYYDRLATGGFRHLLDSGSVYSNAHHRHANTETVVGHTTLATGADPSVHGMVGNVWFDRASGRLTYNVEDPRYPVLGKDGGVEEKTEIDPTQRAARSDGRSPSNILVSTFSDELTLTQGGRSKVFAVSMFAGVRSPQRPQHQTSARLRQGHGRRTLEIHPNGKSVTEAG